MEEKKMGGRMSGLMIRINTLMGSNIQMARELSDVRKLASVLSSQHFPSFSGCCAINIFSTSWDDIYFLPPTHIIYVRVPIEVTQTRQTKTRVSQILYYSMTTYHREGVECIGIQGLCVCVREGIKKKNASFHFCEQSQGISGPTGHRLEPDISGYMPANQ